jgi:hypothetical protein
MYTGWGFDRDSDGTIELYDDIYHDFLEDFSNHTGNGEMAYSHYVPDFWGATLTANGETWEDYFLQSDTTSTMLQSIDSLLNDEYGIYISIGGHAITAWGFEYDDAYDPATDPGNYYTRLAVTDSDDFSSGIQWYDLDYDGTYWELTDYGTAGRNIYRIDAYASNPYAAAVPEPSTLLLIGTGLIGLAGFRRKFFRKY